MLPLHLNLVNVDKMRNVVISVAFFVVILIGFSCKNRGSKGISEGAIHYSIVYEGDLGFPREVLPRTLVISFKQNKILFEMLSIFGNSGIINLSNHEDKIYDIYLSFFASRYYYEAAEGELFPGFDDMSGLEIRKTDKTMEICSFHCKHAEITLPFDRNNVLNVWYTDEIDIKNPNHGTPFKEIEGVLMDFFFYFGETKIYFTAENVYSKRLNDNIFSRRNNYERVTREEINELITSIMGF
jgi:hypothetical protein